MAGTFQYMAPEQFEGKEADARSDVFAFGVVLYEMVTGRKAFEGKTQASLIVKITTRRGPIITLAEDKSCDGGSWNSGETILFGSGGSILQAPAGGGNTSPVLVPGDRKLRFSAPRFLPDGRHFLFYANSPSNAQAAGEQSGVYVGDLKTREYRFLWASETPVWSPRYVPPGFVLYARQGTLMAQRFDAGKLTATGDPIPIAPVNAAFAASDTGVLAYFSGGSPTASSELLWYSRDGKHLGRLGSAGRFGPLRLSPDGRRLALEMYDPVTRTDIWVHDLARDVATRITSEKAWQGLPAWSPNGKQVLFNYADESPSSLHVKLASGLGQEEVLFSSKQGIFPTDWSSDGRYVAYMSGGKIGIFHVTEKKPALLLNTAFNERGGRFSPDGKWLAYSSDESGRCEVYFVPFPGLTEKWRVSTEGGGQPAWRRDGKELFYIAADNKMISVAVTQRGPSVEFGKPVALFETRVVGGSVNPWHQYDVTADGQKFIVNSTLQATAEPITVVSNWTGLLKK